MTRKTFFTSDLHFGHANIIKYANRPFKSVREMDDTLIKNWNAKVTKSDVVWILGDFAFLQEEPLIDTASWLDGEKHVVWGNHDKVFRSKKVRDALAKYNFVFHSGLEEIYVPDSTVPGGKQHIVLCHYAMRVWNKSHRGSWQLYGHSHGSLPDDPHALSVDVGVDCWNYAPVSYEELKEVMAKKDYQPIDHHGRD